MLIGLAVGVALTVLSALFSASETAVMLLSPGRVHRLAEAKRPGSYQLDALAERRHRLRAVSMLIAGAAFSASTLAALLTVEAVVGTGSWRSALAAASAIAIATVLVYTLAQALPRTIAATNAERIALDTAPLVLPIMRALYPIVGVLGAPWKWAVDVAGGERTLTPWAVTAEWRGTSAESDAEREEAEEALLEAVSDFAEKVVREIMVPRTDMSSLPDTATCSDAVEVVARTGYSRLPVYHDTVDDVRGVLYAKDLLKALADGCSDRKALDLARTPYFVPETKPVEELLVEMRERTHIAIVADEYGGTAGLVTLEDLLEEIVGDIADEYDREEPLVVELGDQRYRVDARLPVDDLNELLGTDLDTETDSVGGLFTEVAGRIPERGESVVIEGVLITVTELQGTRIRQLTVEPHEPTRQGETDA